MSDAFPKTLIIDVGKSWTKAFLVATEKAGLILEKRISLPTSIGDIGFTINYEINQIKLAKENPIIITGALPEAENFAKEIGASYVSEEEGQKTIRLWLESSGFTSPIFLDAGNYTLYPNMKTDHIGAFLTNEISEVEIENYLGNKSLRSQIIPEKRFQLEIEEAFARFVFSRNQDFIHAKNFANVVVTGSFFSLNPKETHLPLILLDILPKNKTIQVKLDKNLFLSSFGALLTKNTAVKNLSVDFLVDLGVFVSLGGENHLVLDYGFNENQEITVLEDEIALVPAGHNQKIVISMLDKKEKKKVEVHGGGLGILLDGRVKPLKLAFGIPESREAMKRWHAAIDKLEMIE